MLAGGSEVREWGAEMGRCELNWRGSADARGPAGSGRDARERRGASRGGEEWAARLGRAGAGEKNGRGTRAAAGRVRGRPGEGR